MTPNASPAARAAYNVAAIAAFLLLCDHAVGQEQIAGNLNALHSGLVVVVRAAAAIVILAVLATWLDGRFSWGSGIVAAGAIIGMVYSRPIADRLVGGA